MRVWLARREVQIQRMGLYERRDRLFEQLRILRHRVTESSETPGLVWQLIIARRDLLRSFLLVGTALVLCDWATARWVLPWLWRHEWYRHVTSIISYPSDTTIDGVLSVIIGVLGGVIALLIAISLLVVEVSADRYTSRMIRYFLREHYGRITLHLMIVTLLLALWAAFLQQVLPFRPYLTVLSVVVLTSIAVVSLVTYRTHAVLGMMPTTAFNQLGSEARRLIAHASGSWTGHGRSVDKHLRERVDDDVRLIAHFAHLLVEGQREEPEQASGIAALGGVLSTYIREKRKLSSGREWFPKRKVPIKPDDSLGARDIARPFRLFALGPPTREEPNEEWLEALTLREVRDLSLDGLARERPDCAVSAGVVLPGLMKIAWDEQEQGVFQDIAETAAVLLMSPEFRGSAAAVSSMVQGLLEVAFYVLEDSEIELERVISQLSWQDEAEIVRLHQPRIAQDTLLDMHRKIAVELAAHGRRITPTEIILSEATCSAVEKVEAFRRAAYDAVWLMFTELALELASCDEPSMAPSLAHVLILTYRRPFVRERGELTSGKLEDCLTLIEWLMATSADKPEAIDEVFEEIKEATFESVRRQDVSAFRSLLARYTDFALRRYSARTIDELDLLLSSFAAIGGYALGVAELNQLPMLFEVAHEHFLRSPYISRLVPWFRHFLDHQGEFHLETMTRRTMEYHPRFADLVIAIADLPEVYVERPPALSYDVEHDHPSSFIRAFPDLGRYEEFMKEFVSRLVRPRLIRSIISTLQGRIESCQRRPKPGHGGDASGG